MDIKNSPLNSNPYLDDFDIVDNWTSVLPHSKKCDVCQTILSGEACSTKMGVECKKCVVENIRNSVNAENIEGCTITLLRQAMSRPNGLRWRFLFTIRFNEICQQEKTSQLYGLRVLLIEQLAFVTAHPLSQEIRQLSFNTCLGVGEDIMPLLTKLYRRKPWQFLVNVVILAGKIGPAYDKVSFMVEEASKHPLPEVRQRIAYLLKDFDISLHPWAFEILRGICNDSDPLVKEMARKLINFQPEEKAETAKRIPPIKELKTETAIQIPLIEAPKKGKNLIDLYEEFFINKTTEHDRIEALILEIYNAAILKKIFTMLLIPVFKEHNLIESDYPSVQKLKKDQLATIFTHVLLEENLFQQMLSRLPPVIKKIFERITWEGGKHNINDIKKDYGEEVIAERKGGFYYTNELIKSNFFLFQIQMNYGYFGADHSGYIYLHDELRTLFKKYLPVPEEAVLKTVDNIPPKYYSYFDENQFAFQIDIFLEYLRQRSIQFTKTTGCVSKASLNKWCTYFKIKEFYASDDKNLNHVFSNLIVNFLHQVSSQNIRLKKIEDIKKLIVDYFNLKKFKHFHYYNLLHHLEGYFYTNESREKEYRQFVLNVLKTLNDYNWLTIDNLVTHLTCTDDNFLFKYEDSRSWYANISTSDYYHGYGRTRVTDEMYQEVFFVPLIKGFFFLFAALGLVNIAYEIPKNNKYKIRGSDYLTVYDGLKYVQLSDFGKYVLGFSDTYSFEPEGNATKVLLDEKRLLISIEGKGKLERMILDRFAEPIGENYYKISYHSFLKDCHSKNDIENNISIFKEKLTSNLPPLWTDFFNELEGKINPLKLKDSIQVYKIKPNKELISLIARDDILKQAILKVEDYHIAIDARNLHKVKKRLQEFGFFIDNM